VAVVAPSLETRTLCGLIAALGQPGFLNRFASACETLFAADQVTSFFLDQHQIRCVLAHRPAAPRLVAGLCADYARVWHARDPLLPPDGSPPPGFATHPVIAEEIGDAAYRARLFTGADLGGKIAVVSREQDRVLYWNLYFRRRMVGAMTRAAAALAESGAVLAQALHKHDALSGGGCRDGARFAVLLRNLCPALSPRETEVAALIAAGAEVAQIAASLGIGAQSVMTFRKRAYAKLGISRRAELSARCAGVAL